MAALKLEGNYKLFEWNLPHVEDARGTNSKLRNKKIMHSENKREEPQERHTESPMSAVGVERNLDRETQGRELL